MQVRERTFLQKSPLPHAHSFKKLYIKAKILLTLENEKFCSKSEEPPIRIKNSDKKNSIFVQKLSSFAF